jgi:hypothetical protein
MVRALVADPYLGDVVKLILHLEQNVRRGGVMLKAHGCLDH